MNRNTPDVTTESMQTMQEYDWPGNVRELSNAIERAMVVHRDGVIRPRDLPIALSRKNGHTAGDRSLYEVERAHVRRVLEETDWNISETARILDVDRTTVYNKIKHYGWQKD